MDRRPVIGFFTEGRGAARKIHPIHVKAENLERIKARLEALRKRPVKVYHFPIQQKPQSNETTEHHKTEYVITDRIKDKENAKKDLELLANYINKKLAEEKIDTRIKRVTWTADGNIGVLFEKGEEGEIRELLKTYVPEWGKRKLYDVVKFNDGTVLGEYRPIGFSLEFPKGESGLVLKFEHPRGATSFLLERSWGNKAFEKIRDIHVPLFDFHATTKFTKDEFKEIVQSGIEYVNGDFLLNPLKIQNLENALNVVEKYAGQNARKQIEARLDEINKARSVIAEIQKQVDERDALAKEAFGRLLGAKVESVRVIRDAVGQPTHYIVRTEKLGTEKFKEIASRYNYINYEGFEIPLHRAFPVLKELKEKGALDDMNEKYRHEDYEWAEQAYKRHEEKKQAERAIMDKIEKKIGAKVERIIDSGGYYQVKLEKLGTEKFKEIAKKYPYSMGYFKVDKKEIE